VFEYLKGNIMERSLATIRRIAWVKPIDGADSIELVGILGWQCVSKKGEFRVDDYCVYFEIDSFLPADNPVFSFLEPKFINYDGGKGARLRTATKLKQLSQGLALPLHFFPEIGAIEYGMNVTDILKVKKWEKSVPSEISGQVHGHFPDFIAPRTDQMRIQNIEDYSNIIGHAFSATVKLDGTSMSVGCTDIDKFEFFVCGRNYNLKENENNSLWKTANKYGMKNAMQMLKQNIVIQGELIGEKIQNNLEKIKGCDFYVFNIYLVDAKRYASKAEYNSILEELKSFGCDLKTCPEVFEITFDDTTGTSNHILSLADGPSLFGKYREGLVFHRNDGAYSFKAISNWWLKRFDN
jgi:RNA ligase (TIGR02306 family)